MNQLQTTILDWFAANARDLPWRKTRDPYRVLVSEIMLQQTQVDRVLPKYLAFMEQFPDAATLASASTADVIKAWQGLGYNRRAVNLQRAAQAVVAAGAFPDTPEGLRSLPGIGAYTSGAVACFAFERDVAFLDTNIRRVIQRLCFGDQDATEATLVAHAQQLVPEGNGWAWNQAIMELGALICTANKPQCWRCPAREHCAAYQAWQSADSNLSMETFAPKVRRKAAETPFQSSNRFYRGRVIEALRSLENGAGMTLARLLPHVKAEAESSELPWLAKLVQGLANDGLVMWQTQDGVAIEEWRVMLPV